MSGEPEGGEDQVLEFWQSAVFDEGHEGRKRVQRLEGTVQNESLQRG